MGQQTIENNNTNKSNITVPSVLYTYIIYIYILNALLELNQEQDQSW